MKLIKLLILGLMMLPVVNAQNNDAVFFNPVFDTIIFLVIIVFLFLAVMKMLQKIK